MRKNLPAKNKERDYIAQNPRNIAKKKKIWVGAERGI